MKKPVKPKDKHKSGFMVRLPAEYHEKLRRLTERTQRKMTTEVQRALDRHFKAEKIT